MTKLRRLWSAGSWLAVTTSLWFACSSNERAPGALSDGCSINTDCSSPLVCAFRRCHNACKDSRDCTPGLRCIASDKPYRVCQLDGETRCVYNSDCPGGQVCGIDALCRDPCNADRDCIAGQLCVVGTCAEPRELTDAGTLPVANAIDAAISGQPCSYSSECAAPFVCRGGFCAYECLATADCSSGQTCLHHRCVAPACGGREGGIAAQAGGACQYSSECAPSLVCRDGQCTCECVGAADCSAGQDCVGFVCVSRAADGGRADVSVQAGDASGEADSGGLAHFAYVAASGADMIVVMSVDAITGALAALGPVAGVHPNVSVPSVNPFHVIVHPAGGYLLAANFSANTISVYRIDTVSGGLTTAGNAVAAGTNPIALATTPDGTLVFAANANSNNLSSYSFDPGTGALTPLGLVTTGNAPEWVAVDPKGKFLYVANTGTNDVAVFAIDPVRGAVATGLPYWLAGGINPTSLVVHPSGRFLYVALPGSNGVATFSIDAAMDGGAAAGPPRGIPTNAGTLARSVAVDPGGQFLFVANNTDSTVSTFAINQASGGLQASALPAASGTGPFFVTSDASGRHVYTANNLSGTVSAFAVSATGALSPVGGPVQAGAGATAIALGR